MKVEFASKPVPDPILRILSQVIFEAFHQQGARFEPQDVMLMDCCRGQVVKAARARTRLTREVEAACESISAIWDRL